MSIWKSLKLEKRGRSMKYSEGLKNNILKQVLPPEKRSIGEAARDYGVADQIIRNEGGLKISDKLGRAFKPDFLLFCK